MPTTYLLPEDHVARRVKPSLVQRDEDTKEPIGIFPEAFQLRPEEPDLSVSWLEYFAGDRLARMKAVVEHSELELRPRDGFGVLQVGVLSEICERHGAKVRVIYDPKPKNPAHTGVHLYPRDNRAMEAELANKAAQDLWMVGDVRKT